MINEQKHAEELSAALEHISVKWLELHTVLSAALGIECLPEEDPERYTDKIKEIVECTHFMYQRARQIEEDAMESADSSLDIAYGLAVRQIEDFENVFGGTERDNTV